MGGAGFTEEDAPNFFGSFYSKTKAYMEDMLKSYKNVCILRVRMPISDDLNPRNFVTKIVKYDRVVDIPNSMTVLQDSLPISLLMADRKLTGTSSAHPPAHSNHLLLLLLHPPTHPYTLSRHLQLHQPRRHLPQRGPGHL